MAIALMKRNYLNKSARPRVCIGAFCCLALTAPAVARTPPAYLFTLAPKYEPDAWVRGAERFPAGAAVYLVAGNERRPVAPGLFASADPFVSYDGTRVLVSGKRRQLEPWQIWETPVSGGTARQITSGEADCTRPVYLPDGRIVYTRRLPLGSALEVVQSDGGKIERLTFVPIFYLTDDVLKDGRILFEAARPESGEAKRELFTVYPDGSGEESLRCDHGNDRVEGRQMSSGDIVFRSDGRLARIQSASASQAWLPQPNAEVLGPVAEAVRDEWILAGRRPGKTQWSLFLWQAARKRLLKLYEPMAGSAVQPVMAAVRTLPRDFPSALVKSRRAANALCLRAGQSREPYVGVPQWVRVHSQNGEGTPIVLGQAEVAKDGSFFVQVPGDRPLRFEMLDAEGRTLRSERNWIWFRTGEQRICVGCHAGPEQAPENRLPEVLRVTPDPVLLGAGPQGRPRP